MRSRSGPDATVTPFRDRREAGRRLAQRLTGYADRPDVLVVGLPRGGVVVAREVARALRAPLDVLIVRKLGVPGHEELAMGAIASGGVTVLERSVIDSLTILPMVIDRVARAERSELERRELAYRGGRPFRDVRGRSVIVVDDGLATGATMAAAVAALRELGPAKIIVAVPIASAQARAALGRSADEVVCLLTPTPFLGVGAWYDDFRQTTDDEVRALLAEAPDGDESLAAGAGPGGHRAF